MSLKHLLVGFIIAILIPVSLYGQGFGNEWIQFSQNYFRIKTAQNGIYRVTYQDLVDAGVPVNTLLPNRYQLFHRGLEQAIFISSVPSTPFQPGDFLEFYGIRNNGVQDSALYIPSQAQPHKFYNLFSDTTAYFLTWTIAGPGGKRMDFVNLFNVDNLPAQPWHLDTGFVLDISEFSQGRIYPQGSDLAETKLSQFDYGEGWTGSRIQKTQFRDVSLTGLGPVVVSGPSPQLKILLAGRNNRQHNVEILVGPSTGSLRSLGTFQFDFYNNLEINQTLNFSDISGAGDLVVRVQVNGFPSISTDVVSLSYLLLDYPQALDMGGSASDLFTLNNNPADTSYIEIQNSPAGAKIYDVTDLNEVRRIGFTTTGSTIEAIITKTSSARKLWVSNTGFLSEPLEPVVFEQIDPASFSYLIISNKQLMQPAGGFPDIVQAYADYRSSPEGGGNQSLVVDAEQLFDQFNYGENSPLALRNFLRFMITGGSPEYLFIIGKGVTLNTGNSSFQFRKNPEEFSVQDLVPTAGFPGSDIQLTAGLGGTTYEPALSTGRIIAQTPDEVLAYFNKVKEIEAVPFDDLWRKNLLHLSGGLTIAEVNRFKSYVSGFELLAVDDFLGANVTSVVKEGNSNQELVNVSEVVNAGVSLITFYGHSAPEITDIEIGDVSDPTLGYNNTGKYTSILVNGCNAGNIFSTSSSFGEDWILTPDLGAIAYLAHSSTGFEGPLKVWSDEFYSTGYGDSTFIYRSIGDIQQEVSIRFLAKSTLTEIIISQVQQVILQADPAVALFGANKSDFEINTTNVFLESFDGSKITASTDSFNVAMIIRNFGRTELDSLPVVVRRILSDNSIIDYDTMNFASVRYSDTLYFKIKSDINNGFGLNRFEVNLDPANLFDEINEANNTTFLSVVIPLASSSNLLPQDFAILNSTSVDLLTQSFDQLLDTRDFLFELDTVKTFNSPFKRQAVVSGKVLATWNQNLLSQDSLVYYWRTRFAQPQANEDTTWSVSSFTYINNGSTGWSQSHFQQFESDQIVGLDRDPATRAWTFEENQITANILTHGRNHPDSDPVNSEIRLNGQNFIVASPANRICRDNSINAMAFDKSTLVPYPVLASGGFDVLDPERCGKTPQVINNFRNTDIEGASARLNAYIDQLPPGDLVVLFSIGDVTFQSWPASVVTKMEEIGASSAILSSLVDGEPYILIGFKGASPGTAIELKGDPASPVPLDEQMISTSEILIGRFTDGTVLSTRIGPASSWISLNSKVNLSELPQTDQFNTQIIGSDLIGNETVINPSFMGTSLDLSTIDPNAYPVLKLQFETEDTVNLTPAQLIRWQVLFEGVAEGILLRPNLDGDNASQLEKFEGEEFMTEFEFRNVSGYDFQDSLEVVYSLFSQETRNLEIGNLKLAALKVGESEQFSITINTLSKSGLNDLTVNVNPFVEPEQKYDNNIITLPGFVNVIPDETNPILDVTFDGRYILDGDIVSPSPLIFIKVVDENEVLFKSDTVGVDIFLQKPCENCGFEQVSFSSPEVKWTAASEDSDFSVEYQPQSLEDGIYTLRAQARDESGNVSGLNPYVIRFEVINESQITHFYPYPNPFSTSTRFVFTLTGSQIPDELKIQIMTVTGKVVREITQDEIGIIRIGNNITDYAWDGRDEFGDQLANGVYLYKVFVRSQGQNIDHRATSADKAFQKGFGKMYLLR